MHIRTFVNTKFFDKCWNALKLNDEDLRKLQNFLLKNPLIGDMIENTGGVRKARWNLGDGKSSGARIIYIDFEKHEKLYFLMAYPKTVKDDLTALEKKEIKELVTELKINIKKICKGGQL